MDVIGWIQGILDRLGGWVYRRGQGVAESQNRERGERRDAVRAVRDAIGEAMTRAEKDRLHGGLDDRDAAMEAAGRAAVVVHEISDDEARALVTQWKRQFDSIPKGWKESFQGAAPGYPEVEWESLRDIAAQAQERLGTVLRDLLEQSR